LFYCRSLSNRDGANFQVLKVACDFFYINLSSSIDEAAGVVKIAGIIDEMSPTDKISGSIKMYTNDSDRPVIHVAVYGVIQKEENFAQ
jgi:hypothetical protein